MSVIQTNDSSYLISGGFGNLTSFLIKVNNFGDTLWTKHYNGVSGSYFNDVCENKNRGFAFIGSLYQSWANDVIFNITDSIGGILACKKLGRTDISFTDQFTSVLQTPDNGYIISGGSSSVQVGLVLSYNVVKLDSIGNILWNRVFFGINEGSRTGNLINKSEYVFVGTEFNFTNICFIKMDSVGNVLVSKRYNNFNSSASAVCQTTDGGFMILGNKTSDNSTILLKVDSNGIFLWSKKYLFQGSSYISDHSVIQTNDEGFALLAGTPNESYLIKTDSIGNVSWAKQYVGEAMEFFQTSDDGYLITGNSYSNSAPRIMIIKTDQFGNSGCYDSSIVVLDSILQFQTVQYTVPIYADVAFSTYSLSYLPNDTVTSLCFTTDISDGISSDKNIAVFPNPTFDIINFNKDDLSVEIYDISGRRLLQQKHANKRLSLKLFSSGIYILKVKDKQNEQVFKIVRK